VGVAVALTACQTGERPSFDTSESGAAPTTASAGETTREVATPDTPDNASGRRPRNASDLFDTSSAVTETAVYEVTQAAQQLRAVITVSREPGRSIVEVRGLLFRERDGVRETCNTGTEVCEPDFAEQQLSDLQITTAFWGPAIQSELESPAMDARIGPLTTSDETIAGQRATCVAVPGPSRSDRYCALASGTLALKDTAAVTIDLVEYRTTFDEALWNRFPE
jgi:hypothetical protein